MAILKTMFTNNDNIRIKKMLQPTVREGSTRNSEGIYLLFFFSMLLKLSDLVEANSQLNIIVVV